MISGIVEADSQELLERYKNVRLLDGRRSLVHDGYLPQRQVLTAELPRETRRLRG